MDVVLWEDAEADLVEVAFCQLLERLLPDSFLLQFPDIACGAKWPVWPAVCIREVILMVHMHRTMITLGRFNHRESSMYGFIVI